MKVGRESQLFVAHPHEGRLLRQRHGGAAAAVQFPQFCLDRDDHLVGLDITGDDKEEIIGRVFFPIVGIEVVPAELIV